MHGNVNNWINGEQPPVWSIDRYGNGDKHGEQYKHVIN